MELNDFEQNYLNARRYYDQAHAEAVAAADVACVEFDRAWESSVAMYEALNKLLHARAVCGALQKLPPGQPVPDQKTFDGLVKEERNYIHRAVFTQPWSSSSMEQHAQTRTALRRPFKIRLEDAYKTESLDHKLTQATNDVRIGGVLGQMRDLFDGYREFDPKREG